MQRFIEPMESRRLMAAGTLDSSFGKGGIATVRAVITPDYSLQFTPPIAIRADTGGRTIVLTRTDNAVNLVRLTADGTRDPRFAAASDGTLVISAPEQNVDASPSTFRLQIDAFNRIYLLVNNSLYRFTSSGRPDRTYGVRGRVNLDSYGNRFAAKDLSLFGSDGDMLVAGGVNNPASDYPGRGVGVVHVDPDGRAEYLLTLPQVVGRETFDTVGLYNPLIRQTPDGKVIVAAEYRSINHNAGPITLFAEGIESVRLNDDLSLDRTYGKRGRAFLLEVSDKVFPVGVRANGSIVGVRDKGADGVKNLTITPDGQYDGNVTDFGSTLISAQFVRQPDGQEIVVDTKAFTLRRLNDDNSIDTTFNKGRPIPGVRAATVATDGSILLTTLGRAENDNEFDVRRLFATEGPAARLVPSTLIAPGRQVPFRVVYRDDDGVNANTITGNELRVIAPDGTVTRAVLTGVVERDGNVIADYYYHPTDNRITAADNGVYKVRLRGSSVFDTTSHAADARTIGSLVVRI